MAWYTTRAEHDTHGWTVFLQTEIMALTTRGPQGGWKASVTLSSTEARELGEALLQASKEQAERGIEKEE